MAKKQARRKRRAFTPEFKAEAVRLCKVDERTVRQVAKDLDLFSRRVVGWAVSANNDAALASHATTSRTHATSSGSIRPSTTSVRSSSN
jgi:transposase